jgi:hypothetical protein
VRLFDAGRVAASREGFRNSLFAPADILPSFAWPPGRMGPAPTGAFRPQPSFVLAFRGSSFDQRGEFRLDELLYALPSGEAPPEFSAFALQSNANVKEWTAGAFERSEFG